jgi:hypothetical protein
MDFDPLDHFMIPVNANNDGPVEINEADHWLCSCGDIDCTLGV